MDVELKDLKKKLEKVKENVLVSKNNFLYGGYVDYSNTAWSDSFDSCINLIDKLITKVERASNYKK